MRIFRHLPDFLSIYFSLIQKMFIAAVSHRNSKQLDVFYKKKYFFFFYIFIFFSSLGNYGALRVNIKTSEFLKKGKIFILLFKMQKNKRFID